MKKLLTLSLVILLALGLSSVLLLGQPAMAQATIYVDASNTTAPWDGTEANPYQNIQDGINAAVSGDTVQVAAGTYYENIILKSGVIVQGVGAAVTTINGGGSGSVVTANNVDSAAKLDGFTITGGFFGIHNSSSSPTITNNTITGNNIGIYNLYDSSSPTITNNIITDGGYGIWNYQSSPAIDYNDVWGNSTNYFGAAAGPNDISQDPLFVNPGAGDYHLQSASPCIDAGSNAAPSLPSTDFEGDPRIVDGNGDSVAVVDMGAYEYVTPPEPDIAVGGEVSPINKVSVLAPWLGLALILVIGGGVLLLRRREAN